MKKLIIIALLTLSMNNVLGQKTVKNYYPTSVSVVNLSADRDREINRQTELLNKKDLSETEQKELDLLLDKYGEVVESSWDIIDGGCSWYCGGGNYKVNSSSTLSNEKDLHYTATNANDLSYQTAWVEGKNGEGNGEYLEYYFKNDSPRVTTVIISNGYMKSESAWKNNNRVKKLKMSVNGKPFGILNLEDSKSDQSFEVGKLGHNANGTDLVLKFEILEVYKGDKYNDTAITEIYFDGIDVH